MFPFTAGAAAAAAATQAVSAVGALVRLAPEEFLVLLEKEQGLLVVQAQSGLMTTSYNYLTSYKGLAFHTTSAVPLTLPKGVEVVSAKSIWTPK